MVSYNFNSPVVNAWLISLLGSRGPAVLDDFTSSYGYKFSDAAGYQWPMNEKL